MKRYCFFCGNKFKAKNGRNYFCSELCDFRNMKECRRVKMKKYIDKKNDAVYTDGEK